MAPMTVGWYGIRVPHPSGVHLLRSVYCFPGADGKLICELEGTLLAVSHARFAGAEWAGPFPSRTHADQAWGVRRSSGPSTSK